MRHPQFATLAVFLACAWDTPAQTPASQSAAADARIVCKDGTFADRSLKDPCKNHGGAGDKSVSARAPTAEPAAVNATTDTPTATLAPPDRTAQPAPAAAKQAPTAEPAATDATTAGTAAQRRPSHAKHKIVHCQDGSSGSAGADACKDHGGVIGP